MPSNIHIERYGQGDAVVFIHGSGWNTHMWSGQKDYLAASMEVMLVDLPGHGKSTGKGFQSVEEYRNVIHEALKEIGADSIFVAGHSLGGAIALSLALACPDMLKGMILIGTGARLKVLPQILDSIIENKEETVRHTVEMAFSQKTPTTLKNQAFHEVIRCPAEVISGDFHACNGFDVMDSLKKIAVPTLIICGADDALTPPKYSRFLNYAINGSKMVLIEDAGHMVMMEKPIELSKTIEEFVRNNSNI